MAKKLLILRPEMGNPRKYQLIVNPISGVNSKGSLINAVESRFMPMGIQIDSVFTEYPGHATQLAAEAVSSGYDAVLIAGGDGTVNEVAASLVGCGVPMGIIPSGSGNGLARHLNIPLTVSKALDVIAAGRIVKCDTCVVNGRKFFCTSGTGFDADVSAHFADSDRRGKMEYMRSVLYCAANYKPKHYRIVTDDRSFEVDAVILAVCNASQYGNNAYIAPEASVTDGKLDLTIVLPANPFLIARDVIDLFAGTLKESQGRIHTIKSREVVIMSDSEMRIHIDGEPTLMDRRLDYRCIPGSLNVFSAGEAEVKALITPIREAVKDVVRDARIGIGIGD